MAARDAFSAWRATAAGYAVDFVDDSQSSTNIANYSDRLIDPWSAWVKAKAAPADGRQRADAQPGPERKLAEDAAGAYDEYFRMLAQEMVTTASATRSSDWLGRQRRLVSVARR